MRETKALERAAVHDCVCSLLHSCTRSAGQLHELYSTRRRKELKTETHSINHVSRARLDVGQTLSAGLTRVDTGRAQYDLLASSWRGKNSDLGGVILSTCL